MIQIRAGAAGRLIALFSYTPERVARIKPVAGRRWEHKERYWTVPHTEEALARQEVHDLLAALDGVSWIMGMLLYGSGLRLMECLRLRVKDVDVGRGVQSPADRLLAGSGGGC
jgi:integrase